MGVDSVEKLSRVIEVSKKYDKKLSHLWPVIIGLYFILSIIVSISNFLKMTGIGYGILEEALTPVTWSIYGLGILAVYFTYLIVHRRNWHFAKMYFIFSELLNYLSFKPLPENLKAKCLVLKDFLRDIKEEEKPRNIFIWIIASAISFGFFGILASYIIHRDLHKHSMREERIIDVLSELPVFEANAEIHIVKKRSIAHLLLAILSAGLYAPIWIYMFINDFNKHIEEHKILDEHLKRFLERT